VIRRPPQLHSDDRRDLLVAGAAVITTLPSARTIIKAPSTVSGAPADFDLKVASRAPRPVSGRISAGCPVGGHRRRASARDPARSTAAGFLLWRAGMEAERVAMDRGARGTVPGARHQPSLSLQWRCSVGCRLRIGARSARDRLRAPDRGEVL
jgi:hypothetical protein